MKFDVVISNPPYNVGLLDRNIDVCKNMVGEYTDEKAYKILGLTQEEIEHINKQFD